MKELADKIRTGQIDPEAAGRAFFAGSFSASEKGQFLTAFLENGQYESLAAAMHCGLISKEYNHADYLTANTGAQDLDARYFQLLLELITESGLDSDRFFPLMVAVFSAPRGSLLHAWSRCVEAYLLGEAYRDYERVLKLLTRYDPLYTVYSVLMTADRKRTEAVLVERLLYGDGKQINFSAIRKLLLAHKIDVSFLFGPGYSEKELKVREAIVRLALLYKNDARASAFLERVRTGEPNTRIRKLAVRKQPAGESEACKLTAEEELQYRMISGERMQASGFLKRLSDPDFSRVAEGLFFSVHTENGEPAAIVVTHAGGVYDLENRPYVFCGAAEVGVVHPAELPPAYEYLKRLNLPEQPFLQIERPIYAPDGFEHASNIVGRLDGTITTAAALQTNLKTYGFKLLYGRRDEPHFSHAALTLSGIACVISFTPTDFSNKDAVVRLGEARFYQAADFVRLKGKTYIEGAPVHRLSELSSRIFSEFIYALYNLAKT